MIKFKHSGGFNNTSEFLKRVKKIDFFKLLKPYGEEGVRALSRATPVDTGETASLWEYSIEERKGVIAISWTNSKMAGNVPLVIILQYGHATKSGGYVKGRDFINPAMRPVMDKILDDIWREVIDK